MALAILPFASRAGSSAIGQVFAAYSISQDDEPANDVLFLLREIVPTAYLQSHGSEFLPSQMKLNQVLRAEAAFALQSVFALIIHGRMLAAYFLECA